MSCLKTILHKYLRRGEKRAPSLTNYTMVSQRNNDDAISDVNSVNKFQSETVSLRTMRTYWSGDT